MRLGTRRFVAAAAVRATPQVGISDDSALASDHGTVGNLGIFRNDHDPVPNIVVLAVVVPQTSLV
jgi:hypothetical protein